MKTIERARRHERIAKTLRGDSNRPRMVVFRTKKHIYVQIIDDQAGKVLVAAATVSKEFKAKSPKTGNKDAAAKIGKTIAELAKAKGIKKICFDRAGYKFHGRIKSLSDAAREGGLEF